MAVSWKRQTKLIVLRDHSVEWQDVVLRLKAENCGNGRNPTCSEYM